MKDKSSDDGAEFYFAASPRGFIGAERKVSSRRCQEQVINITVSITLTRHAVGPTADPRNAMLRYSMTIVQSNSPISSFRTELARSSPTPNELHLIH